MKTKLQTDGLDMIHWGERYRYARDGVLENYPIWTSGLDARSNAVISDYLPGLPIVCRTSMKSVEVTLNPRISSFHSGRLLGDCQLLGMLIWCGRLYARCWASVGHRFESSW
jgi:hypothetical protein